MTLQGVLHDGQAEPRTSKFPRASGIDTEEPLGHPRNAFLRDADSGIPDGEDCTIVIALPTHFDGAFGRGETNGVTHQVVKDRMHFSLASQQRKIGHEMHGNTGQTRNGHELPLDKLQHPDHIDKIMRRLFGRRFQMGEFDQVAQYSRHPRHLPLHFGNRRTPSLRNPGIVRKRVQITADNGQR